MLIIKVAVKAPAVAAQGIKEDLAMYLERFGDARVVEVSEIPPEQMMIGGAQ